MNFGIRQKSLPLPDERLFITARNIGFDGVELNTNQDYRIDRLWRPGEAERIRDLAENTGIEVHAISLSAIRDYNFISSDAEKRRVGQCLIEHLLTVGSTLGISNLVLPLLSITHSDVTSGILARGIGEAAQSADEHGIALALEMFLDTNDALALLQEIASERARICFDVGLVTVCGDDVYDTMNRLRKVIAQIHIKDSVRLPGIPNTRVDFLTLQKMRSKMIPLRGQGEDGGTKWTTQLGEGSVDFVAVKRALRDINYDGYLILETPPGDDPVGNASRNLGFLRDLVMPNP